MNNPILIPLCVLALWSLLVTFLMFFNRLAALQSKAVRYSYFRVMQVSTGDVPERMLQFSRHYSNLFEMPVLFYALGVLVIVTGLGNDSWLVSGAWAYVALRCIHSIIHLTYNNVTHRLVPFALSTLVLMGMWLRLLLVQLNA